MIPAFSDDWATVWAVDALEGAKLLEPQSVHTIVTSPPYWGLRSYLSEEDPNKALELGAEKTPEEYVERLVEIFRALKPALRADGTLWLNLSSTYAGGGRGGNPPSSPWSGFVGNSRREEAAKVGAGEKRTPEGFKPKDLIPIPWMAAMALQRDGWWLRADCIWSKPNPMPSSVTDRPTSSHEYVFLLSKSPRYFFDAEAVREKCSANSHGSPNINKGEKSSNQDGGFLGRCTAEDKASGRNIRSVWTIATKPYPGSHYATFPPDLVYPCIKAATSERGACAACGAPWERVVENERILRGNSARAGRSLDEINASGKWAGVLEGNKNLKGGPTVETRTVGWEPGCECDAETVPATVLDPFVGSGTALWAARKLGRKSIGFDLDPRNIALIEKRMGTQGVLL